MSEQISASFRAGDIVRHQPSGEEWMLGRADAEHVEPFGWPRTRALADDCRLVRAATDEQHHQAADDARRAWG